MRPHLGRCLVLAALGGASVLASGVAQAAPQAAQVQRSSGDGLSLGRPLFSGQFDPVGGMGGGVISGGGRPVFTHADGGRS
ncbi:hypothetical protein [Streptomyces decoyicus]|uniref:hypothetical protein n=1 Tax=Streptomyces decoyicus TaxID=249567 RepID=UPI0004AAC336|nr:hypothetical protein [Streptomyces decoyicus]KOG49695.1 hypothetical protein ADK74_04035 [Streptomyces decoyicus]QZY17223.1 hypothetical protein K7C20_19795 [Streptomyces decoyicus]